MQIHQTVAMLLGTTAILSGSAMAQSTPISADVIEVIKEQAQRDSTVKILQSLRYTALNVDFDRMPAREAFGFFQTALGINMVGRYSDDAIGFGIDPDTPITLQLRAMPATDVLALMLEQCSTGKDACAWQLRGSYLEIGTKSRLGVPAAQVLRVYSISDLVRKAPNFDDAPSLRLEEVYEQFWSSPYGYGGRGGGTLRARTSGYAPGAGPDYEYDEEEGRIDRGYQLLELIRKMVEPDAWAANGGTWARIEYNEDALVVTAPDFVHRQIGGYPKVPPPESESGQEKK